MYVKVFQGQASSLNTEINKWLDENKGKIGILERQVAGTGTGSPTCSGHCFVFIWYHEKIAG